MLTLTLTPSTGSPLQLPGMPSWMARLLSARGVATAEEARRFLHPDRSQLLPPEALNQLSQASALLRAAAETGNRIVIYGDYDVDGVCASAILYEALKSLGNQPRVYLPDRHREGYGLNIPAVEALAKEADLLVTVDCGITSVQEVQRAKELGLTVIVTDHHRHGDTLPPADAVVSPLLGDYPFPFLCGAGVAWKLALALTGDGALPLMELAALATIADMVPLTGENRVIAALGLKRLGATRRPGLRALMDRAGIAPGPVSSDQVGYQIAPRINACGRMASARIALDLLLTQDAAQADALALQMEKLNQKRKDEEGAVLDAALAQVESMDLVEQKAIVVWGEGWNSGVVGLAAGRVAEKYAYPTVALAIDGDTCVGSARSAGEVDIHKALSQCADLFDRFGGHKQAAGLTLQRSKLAEFSQRLSRAVAEQTGGRPILPEIRCDGEMDLADVTPETVALLSQLEPFGMGNPAPRFLCGEAQALSLQAVGVEGRHLKCHFLQHGEQRAGIFFGAGALRGKTSPHYALAFTPTLNEFRGRVSAECRIYGMKLLPETLPREPLREALSLFSRPLSGAACPEMDLEQVSALMAQGQGTALVCHCRDTALALLKRFPQADFCLSEARDSRAFSAILLYPEQNALSPAFRNVILCDGDPGEGEALQEACPQAKVSALPLSPALSALLSGAFAQREALLGCYRCLAAAGPFRDLEELGAACGLSPLQTAFALNVFAELELIDYSLTPFQASLLPRRQRRKLEESQAYRLARREKEHGYGLHQI